MAHRYRLARSAFADALREWKEQGKVYAAVRRRVRAFRHEVYKAREALRDEWR